MGENERALSSPAHAVLGASSPAKTAELLKSFGFEVASQGVVAAPAAAALYGLAEETEEITLQAGDSSRGGLRLVGTEGERVASGPFDSGPHAIDLYVRDIDRALEVAAAAGAECGPAVEYSFGPLTVREAKVLGPDGLAVVFLEVETRRSSLLDTVPERLFSEVHSLVWTVDSVDRAAPFWRQEAGLEMAFDATVREPEIARFMGLPRADAPLRLAMLGGAEFPPARLEFLEFPEDEGEERPSWPLGPGVFYPVFEVGNLDSATARLPTLALGKVVAWRVAGERVLRAAHGQAPGGVRVELREG